MKDAAKILILGLIMFFYGFSKANAKGSDGILGDSGITVSGTLDYYSKYVWRGYTLDENPVVQPAINLSYRGLSLNLWTNMAVTNRNNSPSTSNEVDITLSYSRDIGPVTVSVGHISYQYPTSSLTNSAPSASEYYASASTSKLPVELGITYYKAYDSGGGSNGSYCSIDADKQFSMFEKYKITYKILAHYGMFKDYYDITTGGDYSLGGKFGIPLTAALSASPSIYYFAPTGDLADSKIGAQNSGIYGGLSLAYSF